jgi:hypothetical protein
MTVENHRALVLLSALAFFWNLSIRIEPGPSGKDLTPESRWVADLLGPCQSTPHQHSRMTSATRPRGNQDLQHSRMASVAVVQPDGWSVPLGATAEASVASAGRRP